MPPSFRSATTNLRRQPLAAGGVVLLALFVCAAIFAPWLVRQSPSALDLGHRLSTPNSAHWFGTDELGRDIFSRVLYGSRISLGVSSSVVALSLAAGTLVGVLSGFYGGALDVFLNIYVTNAFLSLPGILLAIAFVAFVGPGLPNVVAALALSGWIAYARLVRAQVQSVKQREFVEAAQALGASHGRIIVRHILPNILQPLLVQASVGLAGAVLAEATLSFLGLGVPAPAVSWGSMLNDARSHLFDSPHLVFFPVVALMLLVLAFNFVGDALRDRLDPRARAAAEIAGRGR